MTIHPDHLQALGLYVKGGGPESGHRFSQWITEALGVSARSVGNWRAEGYPEYARSSLELLKLMPPEQWPERWAVKWKK